MRVLVEQSKREACGWIKNLDLENEVKVHLLMGGIDADEWYLHPEKPAILIGTQDMLLSRALNRGYAASRFHWPIDFGLLNNDCLWVFDEPQLMASGVSTSAKLAGLRKALGTFGQCPSVWMSATLEPGWLDTIDFRGKLPGEPLELKEEDYDPDRPLHKRMTATKTLAKVDASVSKDMKEVAKAVLENHVAGTQTLVVVNTVDRAKAVYAELEKLRKKSATPRLLLVHSRFRPAEREVLNEQLQAKGEAAADRIIVATQVVEAGVDISAARWSPNLPPGRASSSASAAAIVPATTVRGRCFGSTWTMTSRRLRMNRLISGSPVNSWPKLDGCDVSPKAPGRVQTRSVDHAAVLTQTRPPSSRPARFV